VAVSRLPLTLRALLLVPLVAATVDQARATLACGWSGQSCLETAGGGALGAFGVILLIAYALGVAVLVARLTVRRAGLGRRWLVAAAGLLAVCGGQALMAAALGDGGALGGGWLELVALCGAAGGVVALALRAVRAGVALAGSFRPSAPRWRPAAVLLWTAAAPLAGRAPSPLATAAAGRAPPSTLA
jgi:hypothetical protein